MGVPMELRTDGFAVTNRVKAHTNPLGKDASSGDVEGRELSDELSEPSDVLRGTRW